MSTRASTEQTFLFTPFPSHGGGEKYRKWRRDLMRVAAGRTDKSGSSLADHLLDIDMGGAGAGAPALPGGASAWSMEMTTLQRNQRRFENSKNQKKAT